MGGEARMGHLTSKEHLALDLIFDQLGESRFNRSQDEYDALIDKLPAIKVLHGLVNDRLEQLADAGFMPYRICYFKAGDRHPRYEDFPNSLSSETIRSALVKSGFREKRARKVQSH